MCCAVAFQLNHPGVVIKVLREQFREDSLGSGDSGLLIRSDPIRSATLFPTELLNILDSRIMKSLSEPYLFHPALSCVSESYTMAGRTITRQAEKFNDTQTPINHIEKAELCQVTSTNLSQLRSPTLYLAITSYS